MPLTRTSTFVDLFNLLNGNTVLNESSAFATWRRPHTILTARFVKCSVNLDF